MSTIEKRDEAIDLARYKQAAEEIETGNRDDALWYKAFAEGGGDENATKATYIRLRVEQLRRAAVAASAVRVTAMQPVQQAPRDITTQTVNPNGSNSLYDILGISRTASDAQINAAYQLLKWELDAQENKDAETKNKLLSIQHAQRVLLDPSRRSAYDATLGVTQPKKMAPDKSSGIRAAGASEPLSNRDLYAAYLGEKNQDYYLNKFEEFDQRGDGMHISWNWPACITFIFGSYLWTLYRKIYGLFFALFISVSILYVILYAMGQFMPVVNWIIGIAIAVATGMFANVIYYRRVKAKIAAAQREARDNNELIELLRKRGGVHSWVWWILWAWLAVVVVGILAAIVIPAYSDYTKKSKAIGAQYRAEQPAAQLPANNPQPETEQPTVELAKSMLVGRWVCKDEQGEFVGKTYYPLYLPNFKYDDPEGGITWDIMPDGALSIDTVYFGSSIHQLNWVTPTEFVKTSDRGPQASANRYSVARCSK